jgi:hypothetical protein
VVVGDAFRCSPCLCKRRRGRPLTTHRAAPRKAASAVLILSTLTMSLQFGSSASAAVPAIGPYGVADGSTSSAATSTGVDVFGVPLGTVAWVTIGVLALISGLIGSTRPDRSGRKTAKLSALVTEPTYDAGPAADIARVQ